MPKDSVQIEIDSVSLNNLEKQFNALGTTIKDAGAKAVFKVLMKIKTTAQNRLLGRGHIVTSRLRNSIYVQMNNMKETAKNSRTYKDDTGKSYDSEMKTVTLANDLEGAVGTNVEYASDIEFGFRPHVIEAKNGGVLAFQMKTASNLKTKQAGYINRKTGRFNKKASKNTLIYAKRVRHPGYAGDSYLYWALKNVDVSKTVGEELKDSIKFGKYIQKGAINSKTGPAMTNSD